MSREELVGGSVLTGGLGQQEVPISLRDELLLIAASQGVGDQLLNGGRLVRLKERFPAESLPLGDRLNMAFKGTTATYGRGVGVATATGMKTELGKIAAMLDSSGALKTPLQQRLAAFGRHLGLAVLAICAIVFVVGMVRGEKEPD